MDSVRTITATRLPNRRTRALALIGVVALLTLSLGAGVVSAGSDSRNADNTFTKWVTNFGTGTMVGVVGGDVGDGTYAGQVLSMGTVGDVTTIHATYGFNGSRHSFIADVQVVQTGATNGSTAVITGVVTDGWLKGNQVQGEYTQIACTNGVEDPQRCYRGTLDILRGSKHVGPVAATGPGCSDFGAASAEGGHREMAGFEGVRFGTVVSSVAHGAFAPDFNSVRQLVQFEHGLDCTK